MEDSSIQEALQAGLDYAQGLIAILGSELDSLTSSDIQGLNAQLATLDAAIASIQLLPGPQGTPGAMGTPGPQGPAGADGADGQSGSVTAVDFNKEDCTNQGNSSVMKSSLITITFPSSTVSYCVKK
jgi:hypothetical protein